MDQLSIVENLEKLPEVESKRRAELETVIKKDLKAFIRVGSALAEINHNRLYRSTHHSFEEYLSETWDLGKSTGYQLIDAHIVIENLSAIADENLLPQNEAQIRPLVPYKNDPEKLTDIWKQAIETAPSGKITAKHVQQTLFNIIGKKTKEDTGKTRAAVNKHELFTPEFKSAFDVFLQEIERAMIGNYKATSREAILIHLDSLREIVANNGEAVADYAIKAETDRKKLIEGGFRILRKNQETLSIEEQTGAGFWEHLESCQDADELTKKFNSLMRQDSSLRG